jgi:hypothetical protein
MHWTQPKTESHTSPIAAQSVDVPVTQLPAPLQESAAVNTLPLQDWLAPHPVPAGG